MSTVYVNDDEEVSDRIDVNAESQEDVVVVVFTEFTRSTNEFEDEIVSLLIVPHSLFKLKSR